MNILFIENSYTYYNDLEKLFEALCRENGKQVTALRVTKGGRRLLQFKDAEDATTCQLTSLLEQAAYDVCFLQEQSLLPATDFAAFWEGVSYVNSLVKTPATRVILYATWARKAGSPVLEAHNWTPDTMTEALHAAYTKAAAQLEAEVSPVGIGFRNALRLDPALDLYDPDMSHPSRLGSCLAALTHYRTLFGVFPEKTASLGLTRHHLEVFQAALI